LTVADGTGRVGVSVEATVSIASRERIVCSPRDGVELNHSVADSSWGQSTVVKWRQRLIERELERLWPNRHGRAD
jgi:hypothetical protein